MCYCEERGDEAISNQNAIAPSFGFEKKSRVRGL